MDQPHKRHPEHHNRTPQIPSIQVHHRWTPQAPLLSPEGGIYRTQTIIRLPKGTLPESGSLF